MPLVFVFVADVGGGGKLIVLVFVSCCCLKECCVCSLLCLFAFVVDVGIGVGCVDVVGCCSCCKCCRHCCWTCCWLCSLLLFVVVDNVGG